MITQQAVEKYASVDGPMLFSVIADEATGVASNEQLSKLHDG